MYLRPTRFLTRSWLHAAPTTHGRPGPRLFRQILELLELATADSPVISPAAVLCRVEGLLLRGTGASSVDAFLVDRWFNKLLHFSAVAGRDGDGDGEGKEGGAATAGVSGGGGGGSSTTGEDGGGATGSSQDQTLPHETMFHTEAICDIGQGVAGMAAMTGRKLRIRDCSRAQRDRRPEDSAYGTHHESGSLVCWPVRERIHLPEAASGGGAGGGAGGTTAAASAQLEDVDVEVDAHHVDEPPASEPSDSAGGEVLAVLQLHCAEGVLSPEAVGVLHTVGRLLVPLLKEALAREEEYVHRRSTEALLSLSSIVPREMGLVAMVEEVVRVAQMLTEAERVCFFFVDDAADELWVAKSVDFDNAKIKIGQGLCGHAAATGGTVNVIDSYEDSRFDRQWDRQTGFVTRRYVGLLASVRACVLACVRAPCAWVSLLGEACLFAKHGGVVVCYACGWTMSPPLLVQLVPVLRMYIEAPTRTCDWFLLTCVLSIIYPSYFFASFFLMEASAKMLITHITTIDNRVDFVRCRIVLARVLCMRVIFSHRRCLPSSRASGAERNFWQKELYL